MKKKQTKKIRFTREQIEYHVAFDLLYAITAKNIQKFPRNFLDSVDRVLNYLGDKAHGRKPNYK